MEVLRDHILGVSDSGKVSGSGVWRTPTGGRTGAKNLMRCSAEPGVRSMQSEPRGSAIELECLAFGERQINPDARFVSWPGSNVFPEAGSLGVLILVRQPSRLQWKESEIITLANLKRSLINQNLASFIFISGTWHSCLAQARH